MKTKEYIEGQNLIIIKACQLIGRIQACVQLLNDTSFKSFGYDIAFKDLEKTTEELKQLLINF